jgi:hypothetical protein
MKFWRLDLIEKGKIKIERWWEAGCTFYLKTCRFIQWRNPQEIFNDRCQCYWCSIPDVSATDNGFGSCNIDGRMLQDFVAILCRIVFFFCSDFFWFFIFRNHLFFIVRVFEGVPLCVSSMIRRTLYGWWLKGLLKGHNDMPCQRPAPRTPHPAPRTPHPAPRTPVYRSPGGWPPSWYIWCFRFLLVMLFSDMVCLTVALPCSTVFAL